MWNDNESGIYTVFDSASPDIIFSALYFDNFVKRLNETSGGKFITKTDGRIYALECDTRPDMLPDVHFQVGWHMLQVRPIDYLWPS